MAEVHFYTPYNFALVAKDEDWGAGNHSAADKAHNPWMHS